MLTGCYTVQLPPPDAHLAGDPIPVRAAVSVPPETADRTYEVRSGLAGVANRWTVDSGDAVANYAAAYLPQAVEPGDEATVQVDLVDFEVSDLGAKPDLRFTVTNRDQVSVFQETYACDAKGHFGQVFWGGAFAMKSALRKTTDKALRSCFEQFIVDARGQYPSWPLGDGTPSTETTAEAGD
jgi:hypothetical protein